MPIESPVFSKASSALWALERLLSGVMADMSHQRTFLPEASQAELTHVRFLITVGPLVNLQGVLSNKKRFVRDAAGMRFMSLNESSIQHKD